MKTRCSRVCGRPSSESVSVTEIIILHKSKRRQIGAPKHKLPLTMGPGTSAIATHNPDRCEMYLIMGIAPFTLTPLVARQMERTTDCISNIVITASYCSTISIIRFSVRSDTRSSAPHGSIAIHCSYTSKSYHYLCITSFTSFIGTTQMKY